MVLLSLATTALVVVSFVVPLSLLVSRQAADRAKVRAETGAQAVASLVALAAAADEPASVAEVVGNLEIGTIVVLDDQTVIGEPVAGQGSLAPIAADTRMTIADEVPGGWEVALPVVGAAGVAVVDSFVTDAELSSGVTGAWLLLGLLAVVLVAVSVFLADRMGRGLVEPIQDLAFSAHRLAEGDLETRVEPREPSEIREVGEAFNYLAGRLDALLAEEREGVADVSHRLRTPLTSLRLQAEALADPSERAAMMTQVDRVERATDQIIELARAPGSREPQRCHLDEAISRRAGFWSVLAEEQEREMVVTLASGGTVDLGEDEVGLILDTLVGNVFSHTAPGTGFTIGSGRDAAGILWMEVADEGAGFDDLSALNRGASGGGSTGLGLDIVRKTARAAGGGMEVDNRPGGGAVVRVGFG